MGQATYAIDATRARTITNNLPRYAVDATQSLLMVVFRP